MNIQTGIPDTHKQVAALLYWDAFGEKLGRVLGPDDKALTFIDAVMRADHGICAFDNNGKLLGVAGFKTTKGALVGADFSDIRAVYGLLGAVWRSAVLAALEGDIENERFLMDGLFVAPQARSKGVGTALLQAFFNEAKARGYQQVRLDVINTNHRAKALYLSEGFVEFKTQRLGFLRYFFGFKAVTTMVRDV